MKAFRISERKFILFTLGLLIVAGLIRLLFYKLGVWAFYLSFVPFVVYRSNFYIKNWGKLSAVDRYRRYTLGTIVVMIVLNLLGFQDVEFILLLLLLVDYIIIVNNPRKKGNEARAEDI